MPVKTTRSKQKKDKKEINIEQLEIMNLDDFCNVVVPDFTPLGGNRPDCAIVMAAAVSLLEECGQQSSLSLFLPPDVLDTAMAATCATVTIRSASDVVPLPRGSERGDHLTCRMKIGCDAVLNGFRNPDNPSTRFQHNMPWRNFDTVSLQIALPDAITLCAGDYLLNYCRTLAIVDLRKTKLQTVGDFFLCGCYSLEEVYLPETLHTVPKCFLYQCYKLVSIDLRNTKLHTVGSHFLASCGSLKEIHIPDTLHTVSDCFLYRCSSVVSIDLRHTKLQSVGDWFCHVDNDNNSLTAIHLPATLMTVGDVFLPWCGKLGSIDLRHTKLQSVGDDFLSGCSTLTEVHLPDTLHTHGDRFLAFCKSLSQETVENMKRSIAERRPKRHRN